MPGRRACDYASTGGQAKPRRKRGRDCVGQGRRTARTGDGRERGRLTIRYGLRDNSLRRIYLTADSRAINFKAEGRGRRRAVHIGERDCIVIRSARLGRRAGNCALGEVVVRRNAKPGGSGGEIEQVTGFAPPDTVTGVKPAW